MKSKAEYWIQLYYSTTDVKMKEKYKAIILKLDPKWRPMK